MRTALVLAAVAVTALTGTPLASAAAPTLDAKSVTVTVDDVSPSTPTPSKNPRRLTILLTLQNTTSTDLQDVAVTAERGTPTTSESTLDSDIAHPKAPDPTYASPVRTTPPQATTLPAGATEDLPFRTTTSKSTDAGVCLCYGNGDAIYPLYFTVTAEQPGTGTVVVGTAQTYLPSFGKTVHPAPLHVTWMWPLLDRPHRLSNQRTFLDDDLTAEVASGGRLDRALQVFEDVAGTVPLTLVVDPDLLDELEVMASGNYRVKNAAAKSGYVKGIGQAAAQQWLTRFTAAVEAHPRSDLELTPFADPDVESLAANGLTWTPTIGDQGSQNRLAAALGTRVAEHDIYWPVGNTLSPGTLTDLVRQGTTTVVVDDRTMSRGRDDLTSDALAQVSTAAGRALAAVASTALRKEVWDVLDPSGRGLTALPELVAHLALRSMASPNTSHYVVLTPPRLGLDVDPRIAERAILATAHTFWSRPEPVSEAATTVTPSDHGALQHDDAIAGLSGATVTALQNVTGTLRGLTGKDGLPDTSSPTAATSTTVATIAKIPVGLQRAASSAWIGTGQGAKFANFLADIVDRIQAAVHLVKPAGNASYTLTSQNAPLPVTIDNPLDVDTQVRVRISAADHEPGFHPETRDIDVGAGDTQQVRIRTSIDRPGRINVVVTLSTRNKMPIGGDKLYLSVRNTELGTVGVAITTIAAVVLALALLFRLFRAVRWRMRQRRSGSTGPAPPVTDPLAP